jgi:hypothetical protein
MEDADVGDAIPWPSPDDDLFGGRTSHWRAVAYVEGQWGSNPDIYALGYREGAELLVAQVLETGYHADALVYPIMFLYRQYVELRMKQVAVAASHLVDHPRPSDKIIGRHELEPLWAHCRTVLAEAGGGPVTDLDNAERTFKQLIWADKGSYAFRYATDKQGNRSLPKDLTGVDLGHVRQVMAGVGNLLDGIVDVIAAQQDVKDDWLQEMASYGP